MKHLAHRFLLTVLLAAPSLLAQDFQSWRDIDYRPDVEVADERDRLDVFMPSDADGVPVLIFFHGGALTQGVKWSERSGDFVPQRFVPHGFGVVLPNYRLTPAVQHPVHLQDAAAAVAWVHESIADYGGDPEQIFIAGHSAGAYLAAQLALDPRYLAAHEIDTGELRGVLPVSAFLDVEVVAPDRENGVWGEDPATWREASSMRHLRSGVPLMLLIYASGDADWRKAQNDSLLEGLKELDNTVELVVAPYRSHTSVWSEIHAPDDAAAAAMIRFMRKHSNLGKR